MVSSYYSLLIQSPGVSNGRAQSSPTCINRTAANDRLADWLSCGRYMVQGVICQTDTSSLYSFSNKRDRTQLAVGVSKPYTYILGGVNDTYGHLEGDRMLVFVAKTIQSMLTEPDFMFRLSGDEFVVVFVNQDESKAEERIKEMLRQVEAQSLDKGMDYRVDFSYGLAVVYGGNHMSVSDVLAIADAQMYIRKREHHLQEGKNIQKNKWNREILACDRDFLFRALSESMDDYIFLGDLKTGTFRYSYKMAMDFDLPGQVIEKASEFWSDRIHPDDRETFIRSNEEVARGRVDRHAVAYRVLNRDGIWVHFLCKGRMMRDSHGEPAIFAGIIRNLDRGNYWSTGYKDRSFYYLENMDWEKRLPMETMLMDFVNWNIPGGIMALYDSPGYPIICFNQSVLECTGFTRESLMQFTGGDFEKLLYEEDRERTSELIARQMNTKGSYEVRCRLICNDHRELWVYNRGSYSRWKDGRRIILAFFMDITKEAEREEELRFINYNSADGVFKVEVAEGFPIVYANDGYYRIHGYTRDELKKELNDRAWDLVYKKDTCELKRQIDSIVQKEKRQAVLEYRIVKKDGSIAWVHMDIGVVRHLDGKVYMIGMVMDITQRHELEKRLGRTEQLFLMAREHSNLNMWEYDIQNHNIIKTVFLKDGRSRREVIKDAPERLAQDHHIHPQSIAVLQRLHTQLEEKREEVSGVIRLCSENLKDKNRWIRVTYIPVKTQKGEPAWAIGISEDITAQKTAEIRAFKEESIRDLLAEDMIFSFRFNINQNRLEEMWIFENKQEASYLVGDNIQSLYRWIEGSIAHEGDVQRFQSYYSKDKIREYTVEGKSIPNFEFRYKSGEGIIIWVSLNIRLVTSPDDGEPVLFGYARNIDYLKKQELALQQKAKIDEISGLYNHNTFKMFVQNILQNPRNSAGISGLALFDVDDFKEVNITMDFLAGDCVLKQMGEVIMKLQPSYSLSGHLSGDMYLIFYHNAPSEKDIYVSVEEIRKNLCRIYQIKQFEIGLTVSAGIAYNMNDATSYDQLYRNALRALETVKRSGKDQTLSYLDIEGEDPGLELELTVSMTDCRILDMNRAAREVFDIKDLNSKEIKCYELLQNREKLCPLCREESKDFEFRSWECFVPRLDKTMLVREKAVFWDGSRARLLCFSEQPPDIYQGNISFHSLIEKCWVEVESGVERSKVYFKLINYLGKFYQPARIFLYKKRGLGGKFRKDLIWQNKNIENHKISFPENGKLLDYILSCFYPAASICIEDEKSPNYDLICNFYGGRNIKMPVILIGIYDRDERVGCLIIEGPEKNKKILKPAETVVGFIRRARKIYILQKKYEYSIYHDRKTGLYNYECYMDYIENVNGEVYSSFGMAGVYIVDLKKYNQKYGNERGDKLIFFVVGLIKKIFEDEACYRISGAGFLVLCPDIVYENFVRQCRNLKEEIAAVYPEWIVSSEVWEQDMISLKEMQYQIEEKIEIARNQKRSRRYVSNDETIAEISRSLKGAIVEGRLSTFLQPKANAETGRICGAEALIRYYRKDGVIVTPDRFLPEIERAGLIRHVDLFVLKDVCRLMKKWMDKGWKIYPISLNYSRATILEPGVLDETNRIVDAFGIPREFIEIEITETIGSLDSLSLKASVSQFSKNGYRIALDDFGTKYSNIHVLYSLKLSTMKLDRSIVMDIYHDHRARLVVENVIHICKELNIICVAEGVENAEQLAVLKEIGCDEIQGYYLNKPLPEDDFEKMYVTMKLI